MRLPRFEYVRPTSLDKALSALQESPEETRLLAGGTDLLVNMKNGTARPKRVVYLGSVPGLTSVSEGEDGAIRIGACANLTDLSKNDLISSRLPGLRDAILSVASAHIRNMASIGGNVCLETRCWYFNQSDFWLRGRGSCLRSGGPGCHSIKGAERCSAINSSDTAPMLMALGASLVIVGRGGERTVPVQEFYKSDGQWHTVLEPGEILKEIVVPVGQPRSFGTFIKTSRRRGIDFAAGSIAARVTMDGGACSNVRMVLGALLSAPLVLEKPALIVQEEGLSEAAIDRAATAAVPELGVVSNLFTTAGYKRHLAGALVRKALRNVKDAIESRG